MRRASAARVASRFKHAAWFPEIYDSREEWRAEWDERVAAGEDNPRWNIIARGLPVNLEVSKKNLALADKLLAHKATAKDILKLFPAGVGRWWHLISPKNMGIEDAELYAESQEPMDELAGELEYIRSGEVNSDYFGFSLVLIAERPVDWHPDDNPDAGLMGNSYLDSSRWKTVRLKALRYATGDVAGKWTQVPASGSVRL